jgi:hypothetical protein
MGKKWPAADSTLSLLPLQLPVKATAPPKKPQAFIGMKKLNSFYRNRPYLDDYFLIIFVQWPLISVFFERLLKVFPCLFLE